MVWCCWPCWKSFQDKSWWACGSFLHHGIWLQASNTSSPLISLDYIFYFLTLNRLRLMQWKRNAIIFDCLFVQWAADLMQWMWNEPELYGNAYWLAFIRMFELSGKAQINKDRSEFTNTDKDTHGLRITFDQYCLRSNLPLSYWSGCL